MERQKEWGEWDVGASRWGEQDIDASMGSTDGQKEWGKGDENRNELLLRSWCLAFSACFFHIRESIT
ncbi:unnamed protein product [Linum trigynum]|uniref:Uncharacterized protein n=1 Tax=Linum trigynum TaxID=586398 RepID=A0AAV2EMV9_9ROSI